jgi:hypothetical protein
VWPQLLLDIYRIIETLLSSAYSGLTYQRVAAGMLSAMLFLAALVSIGYYMELQKRGEGHE